MPEEATEATETVEKKVRKKRRPNRTPEEKAQIEDYKSKVEAIRERLCPGKSRGRIPDDKKEEWETAIKEAHNSAFTVTD